MKAPTNGVFIILKSKIIYFLGGNYYGSICTRLTLVAIYGNVYGKLIEMLEIPKAYILKRKSE